MSDYLSHLAARATDTAVTIRPRLASYYESPAMTATTPEFETAELSAEPESSPVRAAEKPRKGEPRTVVITERRETSPPQAASVHPAAETPTVRMEAARPPEAAENPRIQPSTVAPPRAAQTESPARPEPSRRIAPEPPHIQTSTVAPPHAAQTEPPARPESSRRIAAEPPPRVQHETSVAIERVIERIREVPAPPVESPAVRPAVPISPIRTEEPPAPAPIAPRFQDEPPRRDAFQPPPAVTPNLPLKVIAEPRTSLHPRLPPSELLVKAEPVAAPDIHVTIGRIEVRAVPAAEPPVRRAAAPANHMSLDDYLRRRSESAKR